ncbi:Npun_F5749 family FMN-dependent PPOX-type flavoprotein [Crocosphaera sp. XPORK-15E]|uniref:Npun_F5749 family FMN-dependent PPOX-type flavoprotein n=1 Tax=Crocosphaera sp. XPORK-15E TaxID=3110247 RepID=UPI002B21E605|nr:Npun_F5749 family FMN-dependent PPOX-type flavoprotein [Crocosphaera sp. XPORK-15E]MEA5537339.1 Npun_F5749 family FMN-dependent PPOX-type flavoprotein [Crocosphaera sp. XPORK-15E]
MNDNLAPWRTLLSASLHRNRSQPSSRYLQLATVTLEGKPANRTVVFRGFLDQTNQLQMITDSRSSKITQISEQPWGEICWYFPRTREQFRLTGQLTILTENSPNQEARIALWQQLSDSARQQFTWPSCQEPFVDNNSIFSQLPPCKNQPLANFCLLLFEPDKVDHLELQKKPHHRHIYYLDNHQNWMSKKLNP